MDRDKMWYVYLLRCRDNTLYAGMTDNLPKRIQAHNEGKGAKYTRGRGPVALVHYEELESRSAALKREAEIKRLNRTEKLRLIEEKKS